MIPVKLTIQGLYSYQERVEIDFTRLLEGQLFGIFGAVGSGKSALLEAMTYALYKQSERIDRSGRGYNMMNLRSKELFISFEFKVGAEEERFKFEVRSKRGTKDFTNIRAGEHIGYQWAEDKWVPLDVNSAEPILGLSYENFIKTIIIPQGKFQEFLHLTPVPRSEMLQEIFALQRFDLAAPTKRLIAQNQHGISRLEGSLAESPEIPPEAIAEKEQLLAAQRTALGDLLVKIDQMEQRGKEMEEIRAIKEELEQVKMILQSLEVEEASFKQREERLQQFQLVNQVFADGLQRQQTLLADQTRLREEEAALIGEQEPLQQVIKALASRFREADDHYQNRDELKRKVEEAVILTKLHSLEEQLQASGQRIEKGKALLEGLQHEKIQLKEELQNKEQALQKQKDGLSDGETLIALRGWFEQLKLLKRNHQEALAQQTTARKKAEEEKGERLKWIAQPLVQSVGAETARSLADLSTNLIKLIAEQEETLESYTRQRDQLQAVSGLGHYARDLEEGLPCPLCGSVHHPAPYDAEASGGQIAELNLRMAAVRHHLRQLTQLQPELQNWQYREQQATDRLTLVAEQASTRQSQVEQHQATFIWEGFHPDRPEEVDQLIEQDREQRQLIRQLEQELSDLRKAQEKLQSNEVQYQKRLFQLESERTAIRTRSETLKGSLKYFDPENPDFQDVGTLWEQERKLMEQLDYTIKTYFQLKEELAGKETRLAEVDKNLEFSQRELTRLHQELVNSKQSLTEKLKQHELQDLDQVQSILSWNLNVTIEQDAITQYRDYLADARKDW